MVSFLKGKIFCPTIRSELIQEFLTYVLAMVLGLSHMDKKGLLICNLPTDILIGSLVLSGHFQSFSSLFPETPLTAVFGYHHPKQGTETEPLASWKQDEGATFSKPWRLGIHFPPLLLNHMCINNGNMLEPEADVVHRRSQPTAATCDLFCLAV